MKRVVFLLMVALTCGFGLASAQPPERMPQAGQPAMAAAPDVPVTETALGTVRLPRPAMADGKPLPAGTYQARLTAQTAKPDAVGQTPSYERWVEFVQGGQVRGREVVSIVPQAEIARVAEDSPPGSGGSKVQLLRGNEYLRVWVNRGGVHYLVHLPVQAAAK
jgi:hypothetical protein